MSTENKGKLLDEVRRKMRLLHYSIHTERSYCDWIRRFVKFHRMKSRDDLAGGEAKIEAFLTHLAVDQSIAPSTQNQAMNALVFLYKQVLQQRLDEAINAIRATPRARLPVVMTREEVSRGNIPGPIGNGVGNGCFLRGIRSSEPVPPRQPGVRGLEWRLQRRIGVPARQAVGWSWGRWRPV